MERYRPSGLDAQKKSQRAAEQDRPDVAAARAGWFAAQRGLNPASLVFVDESGFSTKMTRRYGRWPRGRRLHAPVPHGHWNNATFVAGLRLDGVVAPVVVDQPMNGVIFRAYVEQFLAPSLRPGDIVIMDNLQCHKAAHIRATIEAAGAKLMLLPPYSPDLNPIEQLFAKLKAIARADPPRDFNAIINTLRHAINRVTLSECTNYIANSGYQRIL